MEADETAQIKIEIAIHAEENDLSFSFLLYATFLVYQAYIRRQIRSKRKGFPLKVY